MSTAKTSVPGNLSLGIGLVSVGLFFLLFAWTIRDAAIAGNGDPGPRWVPIILAIAVITGGVLEAVASRRTEPAPTAGKERNSTGDRDVWVFTAAVILYAMAVPYAFFVSTYCFTVLAIWFLGGRVWVAAAVSAVIAFIVWGLFARLFLVPLPTLFGVLGA